MRLIMLDTETTGLSPNDGHRIVEVGAVEVVRRKIDPTKVFHRYINPERHIPEEVVRIHGIDDARVKDEPTFAAIADEFLAFIEGAVLVIHNAPFDLKFLMHELGLLGKQGLADHPVIDSLQLARKMHPRKRNSLDALSDRNGIDRSHRVHHGALLDSELLAEVYLAMTGGRQHSLTQTVQASPASHFLGLNKRKTQRRERRETQALSKRQHPPLNAEERQAHEQFMQRIRQECGGKTVWDRCQ